jgi:hypothetical protein
MRKISYLILILVTILIFFILKNNSENKNPEKNSSQKIYSNLDELPINCIEAKV